MGIQIQFFLKYLQVDRREWVNKKFWRFHVTITYTYIYVFLFLLFLKLNFLNLKFFLVNIFGNNLLLIKNLYFYRQNLIDIIFVCFEFFFVIPKSQFITF